MEKQLREALPPKESNNFCHRMVLFGRDTCTARSPKCQGCPLAKDCDTATAGQSEHEAPVREHRHFFAFRLIYWP